MDNPEKLPTLSKQDTTWRQTKQKHNTICVWHQYVQANTNNINKTWAFLETTRGNYEPDIVCMRKS